MEVEVDIWKPFVIKIFPDICFGKDRFGYIDLSANVDPERAVTASVKAVERCQFLKSVGEGGSIWVF